MVAVILQRAPEQKIIGQDRIPACVGIERVSAWSMEYGAGSNLERRKGKAWQGEDSSGTTSTSMPFSKARKA